MFRVEIYRLQKGGGQKIIATCHLRGSEAICEGDKKLVKRLSLEGVVDKATTPPTKVFPTEGERFLGLLKDHFSSGYLTASELLEEDT